MASPSPSTTRRAPLVLLQVLQVVFAVTICGGLELVEAQSSSSHQRQISAQQLDRVLKNDILLNFYIKCLLDKGPCDTDGRELRRSIPQALGTGCEKCNASQKRATDRVIRHLRAKRPTDWSALAKKYDPKGEYEKRFATSTPATTPAQNKTGPKPTTASTKASTTASTTTSTKASTTTADTAKKH